ncbi:MAG: thiamine-binding protein, partial [Acidimicrobiia bacterium]
MDGPDPRLEFFVEPFTEGRPGLHVKAAIEAVAARGLEIQVGPFGSVAHGALEELIAAASPLLRSALSAGADRISIHLTTGSHLGTGIGPTSLHDALTRMIADVERELGASLAEL